jgi:signal peptidase II
VSEAEAPAPATGGAPAPAPATGGAPARSLRQQAAFAALAAGIVLGDQLSKAWIVASFPFGVPVPVLGEWLRIWYVTNPGAIFGLFPEQADLLAVLSVGVMAFIVWYHARRGTTWLTTLALGLLLGGAIGNFIDRVRLGYVIDFVDMGVPDGWRFFTWNVADASITASVLLLLAMAFMPTWRRRGRPG